MQLLRRPAVRLAVGVLALAAAGQPAMAQIGDDGAQLMRPQLDGSPLDPPRFRRVPAVLSVAPGRFGELPNFGYRPGLGAGTTGFDSTNATRRRPGQAKAAQTRPAAQAISVQATPPAPSPGQSTAAKPGVPTAVVAPTGVPGAAPVVTGSTSTAAAPPDSVPPVLPRRLQPAGAPLPGRIYFPTRPGAPPLAPDLPAATVATTPPSLRQPAELLPFDPLGIQVGGFIIKPAFEYGRGYDNNAPRNSAPPRASSWYNIYKPELLVASTWARHEVTASLRGSYLTYDTNHPLDRPNLDTRINARIDATRDTRFELEGRYLLFTDSPGSPNIQVGLARLPIAMTSGATAGLGHRFNRFDAIVKGTFDRTVYNDSELLDGSASSNVGRNFNKFGGSLRAGYEITPGVRPFFEVGNDLRQYDLAIDAGGVHRTSQGFYGKGGSTLELSRKLVGEASVGYLTRLYTDPTLENIRGWTIDGSITWLATALTTVKLLAATTVTESVLVGVSGSFTREVTAQVDHAFRRWLVATLRFTRALDDYVGLTREDLRYTAAGTLAWALTREIWVKGEYRQEWRHSNVPGTDYFAHVWLMGVRLQR